MLDNYFQYQISQDIKRKLTACFVLNDDKQNSVKAFYTLSNSAIPQTRIPAFFQKKLPPSYSYLPATLLGRLAVDIKFQNKGLGKLILIDALKRSLDTSKIMGSYAVISDPLNPEAEQFYMTYGFIKLPDSGKMFIPMKTIAQLF